MDPKCHHYNAVNTFDAQINNVSQAINHPRERFHKHYASCFVELLPQTA